jgi:hypothetical protein
MKLTNLALLALIFIVIAFSVAFETTEGFRKKMPRPPAQQDYTVPEVNSYSNYQL